MLKINNRNIRKRCWICSKLIRKLPERRHWPRFGVFIVNFEPGSHLQLIFIVNILRSDKQSKWYFFSWSTVLNQMQNAENKDDLKTNIWNLSYHKRTLKLLLMLGHTQKLHYIGFLQKSSSGNTCDGVSFLIRLGLQYATLFEKRFQQIFSPVNLKKNFRTGFLQSSSVRIFLSTYSSEF